MKNETIKGRTLAIISTLFIFIICLITFGMHWVTGYYLYYFLFMTSLLLGATNLFFMLLRYEETRNKLRKPKIKKRKRRKKNAKDLEEESLQMEEEETTPKKSKLLNLHLFARVFYFVAYIVIFYLSIQKVISYLKNLNNTDSPQVVNAVLFAIIFVVLLILDKFCQYSEDNTPFVDAILENNRIFFKLLYFEAIVATACVIFESLQIYDIKKYVEYLYVALFFYYVVFIVISLMVIAIRKDFWVAPYLNVPIPTLKKSEKSKRPGFIEYLETNTGVSMRSLWSVKYVRQIAPLVVFISAIFLWLSTCIVQVESYQQAAVYRLGVLQEDILGPGLHLTLPYPFDKVEIYNTGMVNKVTIGYKSEESTDNIWTANHGDQEYKLLLGGGDELVSINLRLEYKISDLKQYLKTATSPESILQALAYELVTDQTIATDLSSLLSADRDAFADNFKQDLSKLLESQEIGLEVVSVVLESIHPPVEIASVYQELISAEIDAEKTILYAEAAAIEKIVTAQTSYNTAISVAERDYSTKTAAAKASVAEFMASVEAYNANPDAYTYQKYLAAVSEAYGKANLVILGEGIDQSALFFGSFSSPSEN